MHRKRIGVVLAGCGVKDGSEVHESVLTLLALDRAGAEIVPLAPRKDQHHVVDHATGREVAGERRSIPLEAARIARGPVGDLAEADAGDLDGLIFPGGFGAAKNLCDYAFQGRTCSVDPAAERLIRAMHRAGKPLGFICIAPVIAACVLGEHGVTLTTGRAGETAADIEAMGARHVERRVDEIAVDEQHKVVSTPAYMLGPSIAHVEKGISRLVEKVLEMA